MIQIVISLLQSLSIVFLGVIISLIFLAPQMLLDGSYHLARWILGISLFLYWSFRGKSSPRCNCCDKKGKRHKGQFYCANKQCMVYDMYIKED